MTTLPKFRQHIGQCFILFMFYLLFTRTDRPVQCSDVTNLEYIYEYSEASIIIVLKNNTNGSSTHFIINEYK